MWLRRLQKLPGQAATKKKKKKKQNTNKSLTLIYAAQCVMLLQKDYASKPVSSIWWLAANSF